MKYIDQEEKEFMESFEQAGDDTILMSSDTEKKDIQDKWWTAVKHTQTKKPITIRLQQRDIIRFKSEAQKKGIPYQTLLTSVVHQYASGNLVEK